LETEMNGYRLPAVASTHGSPVTRLLELTAWCAGCGATYPGFFHVDPNAPPPFAFMRQPRNTVCSCQPQWPRLLVMVDGEWTQGRPGSDGAEVVDGASEEAFCRGCGAYFYGLMTLDRDDRSHLDDGSSIEEPRS
jgi:hypothetical protein